MKEKNLSQMNGQMNAEMNTQMNGQMNGPDDQALLALAHDARAHEIGRAHV